jgi:hypothetical protein
MVDEEVENTLREIRERVRATAEYENRSVTAVAANNAEVLESPGNELTSTMPATMERLEAYLTTTGRAWDRLPPVISNRSGALARLELWIKQRFKRATRWYFWEQINFNAAVNNALRDALEALRQLELQLSRQGETTSEFSASVKQTQVEIVSLRTLVESQRATLESQRAEIESQRSEIRNYRMLVEERREAGASELAQKLADIARESRERDQQQLEEQRVCFKQLSLEISETEVLLDRARRELESRLHRLETSKS